MAYLWLDFSFGRMMCLLFGLLECFPFVCCRSGARRQFIDCNCVGSFRGDLLDQMGLPSQEPLRVVRIIPIVERHLLFSGIELLWRNSVAILSPA